MGTLEELRVLDLSTSLAGAYCCSLFAGHGADVISIEPPGDGSPIRRRGGELWGQLGARKRGITLALDSSEGRDLFLRLMEQAQIVVETFNPGRMAALDLGYQRLLQVKRRMVLVSITPFGQTGSGATGEPAAPAAEFLAGMHGFAASAVAAYNADTLEVPQHIDISIDECLVSALNARPPSLEREGARAEAAPEFLAGGAPFRMTEVAWNAGPAPALGEHTDELLRGELGLSEEEVEDLRARKII